MAGKQRTIRVSDDLWIQLQNIAAIQNTTCTDLINEDIKARVSNTVTSDLRAKIDKAVEASLNNAIADSVIKNISYRVFEMLRSEQIIVPVTEIVETVEMSKDKFEIKNCGVSVEPYEPELDSELSDLNRQFFYTTEEKTTRLNDLNSETVETVEPSKSKKADETSEEIETVNVDKAIALDEVGKTFEAGKGDRPAKEVTVVETVETVKTVKTEKLSKEDKKRANLAKFKQYRSIDNRKSYSDAVVAAEEGLKKESVRRYRVGLRSPKQEFIDKWGLSWNGNGWVRNT